MKSNKNKKDIAKEMPLDKLVDTNIKKFDTFLTLEEIRQKIVQSEASKSVIFEGREAFKKVLRGADKRFIIIMGPCSIHDLKASEEYAKRLLKLKDEVDEKILVMMRVYFEKPRTTVGWKGLINDPFLNGTFHIQKGLQMARKLLIKLSEKGVFTATEILDPITAAYLSELVSWASIGARTTESQIHREMVSGLSMPVGFKNSTDGNLDVALNAIASSTAPHSFLGTNAKGQVSVVHTKGNKNSHIVLRGGLSKPNYSPSQIKKLEEKLQDRNFPARIMVDCSHDNSGKNHEKQAAVARSLLRQKKNGNQSIFGMMIESNLLPGNQDFKPSTHKKEDLKYGVSITDKCIGWEETEKLVREFFEKL